MTPTEHVSAVPEPARGFQGRPAGIVTRLAASGVDLLVVVAAMGVVYGVLAGASFLINPRSFSWPSNLGWSIPVVGLVLVWPYLTLCWMATGRTYGDALLGLRVVDRRGRRLHAVVAALRALVCLLFPIGLLWVAVSRNNRSVHDVLLRTAVIYDWTPRNG
jgi:uncharacterized RDD family membrane protein YckC